MYPPARLHRLAKSIPWNRILAPKTFHNTGSGGPVRYPCLLYRPARLHMLTESIPWNRFLGSLNVYKFWFCFLSHVWFGHISCFHQHIASNHLLSKESDQTKEKVAYLSSLKIKCQWCFRYIYRTTQSYMLISLISGKWPV